MEGKKAQAATEFLMTYGFMIFVTLLIVGALAYFGIPYMKNYVPNICYFDTHMPCLETPYYYNGEIGFTLKNSMVKDLNITSITIVDNKCGALLNPRVNGQTLPYIVNQNDIFGVVIDCDGVSEIFDLTIVIKYVNIDLGFKNAVTGRIKGKVV